MGIFWINIKEEGDGRDLYIPHKIQVRLNELDIIKNLFH